MDGTLKKVSPSFKKILGYDESELFAKPFSKLIHSDDLNSTLKIFEKLSLGQRINHFENRCLTKSGEYRRISWACEVDPTTHLVYATGRDVTELRNSEFRNTQIFNAIDRTAIVAFTDHRGLITEVNDNFCEGRVPRMVETFEGFPRGIIG